MSGSNYGGPNPTLALVFDIRKTCDSCMQSVLAHLADAKVDNFKMDGDQLRVFQKSRPEKIRNNVNFAKPRNITAVLGINVDCLKCEENVNKIIVLTPGVRFLNRDLENKLFTVIGHIAINPLLRKLEKGLRKIVKVISIEIECCGGTTGGSGSCSEIGCRSSLSTAKEFVPIN